MNNVERILLKIKRMMSSLKPEKYILYTNEEFVNADKTDDEHAGTAC